MKTFLSLMPGAKFWAFLFFTMLAMVGLGRWNFKLGIAGILEYLLGTLSKWICCCWRNVHNHFRFIPKTWSQWKTETNHHRFGDKNQMLMTKDVIRTICHQNRYDLLGFIFAWTHNGDKRWNLYFCGELLWIEYSTSILFGSYRMSRIYNTFSVVR